MLCLKFFDPMLLGNHDSYHIYLYLNVIHKLIVIRPAYFQLLRGYLYNVKDVWYSKAQKMVKFTFYAMVHKTTVKPTRSGPSILYNTPLNRIEKVQEVNSTPEYISPSLSRLLGGHCISWHRWCPSQDIGPGQGVLAQTSEKKCLGQDVMTGTLCPIWEVQAMASRPVCIVPLDIWVSYQGVLQLMLYATNIHLHSNFP